jgi:endo-1,4-beta-xylanase
VANEAVAMPNFKGEKTIIPALATKLSNVKLIQETFVAARAANPNATLILNDYDTSTKYEKLIQDCLAAGVPIDIIGIQSHQHTGYWGPAKTWEVCERFSKFNKPLNFTETTLTSGEVRKNIQWNGQNPTFRNWQTWH